MAQLRVLLQDAVEAEIAIASADVSVSASQLIYEPDDPDLLASVASMRSDLDRLEVMIVAILRARDVSWDSIASTLGVARQSAHRRLSRRVDDLLESLQEPVTQAEYWTGRHRAWKSAIMRFEREVRTLAALDIGRGNMHRRSRLRRGMTSAP